MDIKAFARFDETATPAIMRSTFDMTHAAAKLSLGALASTFPGKGFDTNTFTKGTSPQRQVVSADTFVCLLYTSPSPRDS